MSRALARFALVLAGCLLATSLHAAEKMLQVTTIWQETSMWCWAASGQMIMEYIGTSTTPPRAAPQCYQANQRFGRTDCCTCPTPSGSAADPQCVRGGWPEFSVWGYNSTDTPWDTALTWQQVVGEIDNGRPFMLAWGWHGGGGHAMVAIGYRSRTLILRRDVLALPEIQRMGPEVQLLWPTTRPRIELRWVMINDPWPWQGRCGSGENASGPFGGDFEIVTYSEFVGGPSFDHDHWKDIYNITPM